MFCIIEIKQSLTGISPHKSQAQEYHKTVDTHTSILSTLQNSIVTQNKLVEYEADKQEKITPTNNDSPNIGTKTTNDDPDMPGGISTTTVTINDNLPASDK